MRRHFSKRGEHSVGVARQYCGTLDKVAHCQVTVSLHWSSAEASCLILWRLYLPKEWLEEAERAAEGKLPPGASYRSKTELALEVIDPALAWELPRLPVVADSDYGNDFAFRQALRERGLTYAVPVDDGGLDRGPQSPLAAEAERTAAELSPTGGAAATPAPANAGRAVAGLGLANGGLASSIWRDTTRALRPHPRLGGSRLAEAGAPPRVYAFLRSEQARLKKTSGVTLPVVRSRW